LAKLLIYFGIAVGGIVGAYLPVLLFKVDPIGVVSILCGGIGSVIGLFVGLKISNMSEY
jgi:hypothetical protein